MALDETVCGSCGRFVGAYEKCPYCGATVSKRLSIKIFRYGSLILSIAGVLILYLISLKREIPLININEISPTMNFAYIRVRGIVVRYPLFDEKSGSLTIHINDGTDELILKAYRNIALKIKELNRIPKIGDIIDVEGNIRLRGSLKTLTINVPEKVKIIESPVIEINLNNISDDFLNKKIKSSGIVSDLRFYKNYISLFITDRKGKNKVRVPINLNQFNKKLPELNIGDEIQVEGLLSYYSKNYNILISSASNIKKISKKPIVFSLAIENVTKNDLNRIVSIKGEIKKIRKFSKGIELTVNDGSGNISVVLWNNIYEKIKEKDSINEGVLVSVVGKVGLYKNKLQIVPALPQNFNIVKQEVKKSEKIIEKKIGEINEDDKGSILKIEGEVESYFNFSKGRRLTLNDGTGSIDIILWNDLLNELEDAEYIIKGSRISVKGKVSEYKNKLEIIPKYASDIEVKELNKNLSPRNLESK